MEILVEGARRLGLTLESRHIQLFELYYRELMTWNERFNLTAISGYEQVQSRHFLDSLTCLLALPTSMSTREIPDTVPLQRYGCALRLADVGSGAGFPGLPIKIMLPDAHMTLIEATAKKVAFLRHVVEVLGLSGVQVLNARAEEVGHMPEHRETYDAVMARAVARMATLAEYCLPLCRIGGRMIAPKGEDAEAEAEADKEAIRLLGGTLVAVKPVLLPEIEADHYLVVVDKIAHTPDIYPRRPGVPAKRPLA
ncbi:MAG: 16S rRNA (guanine(527)-N(7))-methyltransferase RsmG [Chloroflexi bacterium]|nr:16S rRNA (guanine(527)-N(7))-methyltransferase RsmG [Chloroflexota bacterium]